MNQKKIVLFFLVLGQEYEVEVPWFVTMGTARILALIDSHDIGRTDSDWEMRAETGALIHPSTPARLFRERIVYLTVRVGAGGAAVDVEGNTREELARGIFRMRVSVGARP